MKYMAICPCCTIRQARRYLNLKNASDVVSNTGYSAARRDERGDYTIYEEQEVQNLGSLNGGSQTRRVATHTGKTKTTPPKILFDQPTGRCRRRFLEDSSQHINLPVRSMHSRMHMLVQATIQLYRF
jgi:hypothetical protein